MTAAAAIAAIARPGLPDRRLIVTGRQAWALTLLIAAGAEGVVPINVAGPLGVTVHRLRQRGIPIETIRERHGGDYPGTHGRYVLSGHVRLEQVPDPEPVR